MFPNFLKIITCATVLTGTPVFATPTDSLRNAGAAASRVTMLPENWHRFDQPDLDEVTFDPIVVSGDPAPTAFSASVITRSHYARR